MSTYDIYWAVIHSTDKYPTCVTLENYNHDVSYGPIGFLTPMSYQRFYSTT